MAERDCYLIVSYRIPAEPTRLRAGADRSGSPRSCSGREYPACPRRTCALTSSSGHRAAVRVGEPIRVPRAAGRPGGRRVVHPLLCHSLCSFRSYTRAVRTWLRWS